MANDTNTNTHAAVLERMRDEMLREARRIDSIPHFTGGPFFEKAKALDAALEALRAAERYEAAARQAVRSLQLIQNDDLTIQQIWGKATLAEMKLREALEAK